MTRPLLAASRHRGVPRKSCYIVRDANNQSIAYVYARETLEAATSAKVLTTDEARRVAVNIAKLPELLKARA